MDLAKFVNLISTSTLYFARADLLDDPFEGSVPWNNYRSEQEKSFEQSLVSSEPTSTRRLRMRKTFFVNCWRSDDFESEAMWKIYCLRNEGIAIQSTYQKLIDSFNDEDEVYIGLVKYIDYSTEDFPKGNAFIPYLHKRKSFEHEKEVRLLKFQQEYWNKLDIQNECTGINQEWSFKSVIDNVYVNPYAPEWYFKSIRNLIDHYNLDFNLKWSTLKSEPNF